MQSWSISGKDVKVPDRNELLKLIHGAPSNKLHKRIQRLLGYIVFNSIVQYVAFHWRWLVIGLPDFCVKPVDLLIFGWLQVTGGLMSLHSMYAMLGLLGRFLLLIIFGLAGDPVRQRWLLPYSQYLNPHICYALISVLGSLWEVLQYMIESRTHEMPSIANSVEKEIDRVF